MGVLIVFEKSPISYYYKRQEIYESSTYGSELVEMRIRIWHFMGMEYKLRLMGIKME